MVHIKGIYSNLRLQISIKNMVKKVLIIYYSHKDSTVLLTDIETIVISAFPSIFKKEANSMLRYKHKNKQ